MEHTFKIEKELKITTENIVTVYCPARPAALTTGASCAAMRRTTRRRGSGWRREKRPI